MLSMSFVTRLSRSPRGRPSIGAQGQATELRVDVGAEPEYGALGDSGHDVALQPREHRAQEIGPGEQDQERAKGVEVDALAGCQVHARQHRGELVLALRLESGDDLVLGHARGQRRADGAFEDQVGGFAQDARSEDRQRDADDGEQDDGGHERRLGSEPTEQPPKRATEVTGFGRGQAHAHAHHHPAARATSRATSGTGRRAAGRRGTGCGSAPGAAPPGAAPPGRAGPGPLMPPPPTRRAARTRSRDRSRWTRAVRDGCRCRRSGRRRGR